MPSRFFSRYSHLKKVHSLQLSLEKVHTRSQTVTPSDEEVTCEIRRGFESSDQAGLTYPPYIDGAESKNRVEKLPKLRGCLEFASNSVNR